MEHFAQQVYFDPAISIPRLRELLREAAADDVCALVVLLGDNAEIGFEQLPEVLSGCPVEEAVGAIFPALVYGDRSYREACLILALRRCTSVSIIQGLASAARRGHPELNRGMDSSDQFRSLLVFVDGLSSGINEFIYQLYDAAGPRVNVIGAGAGSADLVQRPCLFDRDGLYEDAALVIAIDAELSLEMRHGWHSIGGPFLVTGAEGNLIHSLNYRPAFSVYQEMLESYTQTSLGKTAVEELMAFYPFGIERVGGEYIVRDPIRRRGEGILCVGEVSEQTMVYVLHSGREPLIEAAVDAARKVGEHIGEEPEQRLVLLVDCVARSLSLGADFERELEGINATLPARAQVAGVLSIGEIGRCHAGAYEFLNKSTLLGVWR